MVASLLIIFFSLILLVYWLRYSCILLLKRNVERSAATEDPRFAFGEISRRLNVESDLGPLERSLDRDYRVLVYLIEHASGLGLDSIEARLLVLDYKVMKFWYQITKVLLPRQARSAVREMASVLEALSTRLGEHSGVYDRA
jgi:hypothetical protein